MFEKPEKPYDIYDDSLLLMYEITACHYVSANDLGLIYLIYKNDIKNAKTYLSVSGCNVYSFGQNNFGLFNQYYLNNTGEAEYFYKKASKNKFALVEYNLGYLKETIGTIDDAIHYYINASSHEDEPLIFKRQFISDKKMEISKTFIICLTNLKLAYYYNSKSYFEEAKRYFIRSLIKININSEKVTHKFSFCFSKDKTNDFKYMIKFILSFPLFNHSNQPNLKTKMKFFIDKKDEVENDKNIAFQLHLVKQMILKKEDKLKAKIIDQL